MNQNDGQVQLKAESVIAVYKERLAEVEEENIMLKALLRQLQGDSQEGAATD